MWKYLSRQVRLLLVLILVVFGLTACSRPDNTSTLPPAKLEKVFQIQGKIQQGPDAGLTLNGELHLTLDAVGRLQGQLIRESGAPITVTGQIEGQAIHFA